MQLTIKQGDLFADDAEALVNAVNCKGVMGAGVAKVFKDRFPLYFLDYNMKCQFDMVVVGNVDIYALWDTFGLRYVISFPTMENPGEATRESTLNAGLRALVKAAETFRIPSIAMPALGCGIGGFAFERFATLVAEAFVNKPCDIRLYQPWEKRR